MMISVCDYDLHDTRRSRAPKLGSYWPKSGSTVAQLDEQVGDPLIKHGRPPDHQGQHHSRWRQQYQSDLRTARSLAHRHCVFVVMLTILQCNLVLDYPTTVLTGFTTKSLSILSSLSVFLCLVLISAQTFILIYPDDSDSRVLTHHLQQEPSRLSQTLNVQLQPNLGSLLNNPRTSIYIARMSNITNENVYQMFHSLDGDVEYDSTEFENNCALPQLQDITSDLSEMDVDMDCDFETMEGTNFSGFGPGRVNPAMVRGRFSRTPASPQFPTYSDFAAVDWDSMVSFPEDADESLTQGRAIQLPLRNVNEYLSFPCPTAAELREAAETLMTDVPADYVEETDSGSVTEQGSEPADDMDVDDDAILSAATDCLSIEPPFWDSDSLDEVDQGTTFANSGWADVSELQPRQESWTPELQLNQQLQESLSQDRAAGWHRRGAVSE